VTGAFSVIALVLILLIGAILDLRRDSAAEHRLAEYLEQNRGDAVQAVVEATRSRRIVFLSDLPASAATKLFAAQVIDSLAAGPGIDAIVLEVPRTMQPYIDRYLDGVTENASILLSNPKTLREGPASRQMLELYHRVWQANQTLGADRRIRIIAVDHPSWPPSRAVAPSQLARSFQQRTDSMLKTLDQQVFSRNTRARVLVFMTGWHALQNVRGSIQTGGTANLEITWLADALNRVYPGEVYSFLVDAPGSGRVTEPIAYTGTRFPEVMGELFPRGRFAVRTGAPFGFLDHPLNTPSVPGLEFELVPRDYRLDQIAAGYIYLGN
jgi:hypothetical protein